MQIKDIKASARHTAKLLPQSQRELFLSEIDSLIDKTVQRIESRLVESLKDYYDEVKNIQTGTGDDRTKELVAISYCIGVLTLITNKNDINK